MIEEVRKAARNEYDNWAWNHHIPFVVKNAKILAKKLNADEELAELGALLHDIGMKFGNEDHEITGAKEAEKILKSAGYPQNIIDEIKHCVESHRSSKNVKPKTITAKIVANADAMAHFDAIPALLQIFLKNENDDVEKASLLVYEKIERDWNKKLTMLEAKEMMKEKYHAIKLLFAPPKK